MTTLFVRHRVKDYEAWRRVYDSVRSMREHGGVVAAAVFTTDGDPNDVTVTHDFASATAARALAESNELRDAMAKAGVDGPPTIWIAEKA